MAHRRADIAGSAPFYPDLPVEEEDLNRWSHLRSTRPIAACRFKGARNRLDGPVLGIILRALYKLEDMDDREQSTGPIGGNPYREVAGKLREVARECQLPRERGEKYLTWQNASNAEPPLGIDEPHLPARGKPILVSAIYFADGSGGRFSAMWTLPKTHQCMSSKCS